MGHRRGGASFAYHGEDLPASLDIETRATTSRDTHARTVSTFLCAATPALDAPRCHRPTGS